MGSRGFTLIELLVVILIISIFTALAVPTYIRTTEKVRAKEAIINLELIYAGEKAYKLGAGFYTGTLTDAAEIGAGLNLTIQARDWGYVVIGNSSTTFDATAKRGSGNYSGDEITIDETGTWGGGIQASPFVPSN